MKRILGLYKAPIIVTGILVIGVLVWGWYEWRNAQEIYRTSLQEAGKGVVKSLEGVIDSLNRYSPYNVNHLTIILKGVIQASGLQFALIQQSGAAIVEAGEVPYNLAIDSKEGDSIAGGCFIAWKPIELKQTFEYYNKNTGEQPVLVVGFPMDRFFSDHLRSLRELWIKLIIGFIGIVSAGIIWVLSIHARLLASELDVTRIQKDHFEELGMASAGLAHESKNPLGIIRGLAQRIGKETESDDEVRKMSEQIIDEVDRTSARLGEFMSYAKNKEPELKPVSMRDCLDNIQAVLEPDFRQKGIQLNIESADISVRADEDMLRQTVINLLLNSLAASDKGGSVTVKVTAGKKEAVLEVADKGSGIPADLLEDIFKPYVTGSAKGHGLGLAVVHRIAEQHGWQIDAESEQGKGTLITITQILICD